MKKLLILILLPSLISKAQNHQITTPKPASYSDIQDANAVKMPTKDGNIFYEYIDSSVKSSKEELYRTAKTWFGIAYKNSKYVIQVDDKENGDIIGKGGFGFTVKDVNDLVEQWCSYTIKISCRNNKFRIQVFNILDQNKAISKNDMPIEIFYAHKRDETYSQILRNIDDSITDIIYNAKKSLVKKDDF